MSQRVKLAALTAPVILVLAGAFWIDRATRHFQAATGRDFYQLAGRHYTVPEDGFRYEAGGRQIERWTVGVPPNIVCGLLLASAMAFTCRLRRESAWFLAAVLGAHVLAFVGFALFVAWYSFNIMGVFI